MPDEATYDEIDGPLPLRAAYSKSEPTSRRPRDWGNNPNVGFTIAGLYVAGVFLVLIGFWIWIQATSPTMTRIGQIFAITSFLVHGLALLLSFCGQHLASCHRIQREDGAGTALPARSLLRVLLHRGQCRRLGRICRIRAEIASRSPDRRRKSRYQRQELRVGYSAGRRSGNPLIGSVEIARYPHEETGRRTIRPDCTRRSRGRSRRRACASTGRRYNRCRQTPT